MEQRAETVEGASGARAGTVLGAGVDERLRLFAWAHGENRHVYLSVLRVFDAAHEAYRFQLRPNEVADALADDTVVGDHHNVGADLDDLVRHLDALHDWGVLERAQDTGRVRSIAEYRRRRPVYQLTELGYRAWRAVDGVLRAHPGEGQLQRFAFSAICDDLASLADANRRGDAVAVTRYLHQLDSVFTDMADRAAQFYVMLGQLTQQSDVEPEIFLDYKDRLVAHLQDFLGELQRYRPLVVRAIEAVEATDAAAMIERAAEADDAPFLTPVERAERWQRRWDGLVSWFRAVPGLRARCAADELERTTATAIAELAALLRHLTQSRSRGISRDAELAHLAAWIAAAPDDRHATALFQAAFALSPARHLSVIDADAEPVPASVSWWDAEPVEVAGTLRTRGTGPRPGRPAPLPDDSAGRRLAEHRHADQRGVESRAAAALATVDLDAGELGDAQLRLLLRLLTRALRTGVTVSGTATSVTSGPVVLKLRPSDRCTTVRAEAGTLTLDGLDLELARA